MTAFVGRLEAVGDRLESLLLVKLKTRIIGWLLRADCQYVARPRDYMCAEVRPQSIAIPPSR
jgi:hypothetical protein